MRWLLGPYREIKTYRVAGYLLLGLPLGILEFTAIVTGLSMGLGLFVTLIGIPVLVATLLGLRMAANFERELAKTLLDAPMPRQSLDAPPPTGFLWARLRVLAADRDTWASAAYTLLRLPLGIVDFTVVVTIIALALGGFAQPILYASGVQSAIGDFVIDTLAESFIYLPFSIVFLLTGPRLLLGWANIPRRIATSLLGRVGQSELKREVARILTERGETDAFGVLDELRMRLGRGPFLDLNRVQAVLLALESTGHVIAHRNSSRARYTLV